MRRPFIQALLVSCLLILAARVPAAVLSLDSASSGMSLNGQVELFENVGGRLQIENILQTDVQQRFVPAAGRASVGQSRNPWWIKLQLKGQQTVTRDWWLEAGGSSLLDLRLYLPNGQSGCAVMTPPATPSPCASGSCLTCNNCKLVRTCCSK